MNPPATPPLPATAIPLAGEGDETVFERTDLGVFRALSLDLSRYSDRHFGDYELIEKLGQGGMGVVYRARQLSLDRDVAVKFLAVGRMSNEATASFLREARAAGRLQHPNIVPVFEFGKHGELHFFSMGLVGGSTLSADLRRIGRYSERDAAALMRTIAEAMHYAHSLDVLHLDLKPSNILIDQRGAPQIADFGLARRIGERRPEDKHGYSGTPNYMAPEQATHNGPQMAEPTDIYALGAILFELVSGRTPQSAPPRLDDVRQADGPMAVLDALCPRLSRDLRAIIQHCLMIDPGQRYTSARACRGFGRLFGWPPGERARATCD